MLTEPDTLTGHSVRPAARRRSTRLATLRVLGRKRDRGQGGLMALGLEELSFRRCPRRRDLLNLLGVAVAENVGYRQISIYWRLRRMTSKLRGGHAWRAMERKGFATSVPKGGPAA